MSLAVTLIGVGRVVFGLFFLIAGVRNFAGWRERIPSRTNYGWANPPALVALGFASQLIGGLSLVLGVATVWGALLLIGFLVLATALYHNAFRFAATERDPHVYLVLVNITLAGGLLLVIASAL